jgi:ligand-binding SRPBCC domain-containing protein
MGTCERLLRVAAPAEVVWGWMCEPRNLFSINLFHAEVHTDEAELKAGSVVTIDHDFFGAYQQRRQAKIREVRPYFVAFGEHKSVEAPGRDPFPHQQSFQVVPIDDESCILVNRISGRYVFPGSGVLGERLFRRYMPGDGPDQAPPPQGPPAVAAHGLRRPLREEVDPPPGPRADEGPPTRGLARGVAALSGWEGGMRSTRTWFPATFGAWRERWRPRFRPGPTRTRS